MNMDRYVLLLKTHPVSHIRGAVDFPKHLPACELVVKRDLNSCVRLTLSDES